MAIQSNNQVDYFGRTVNIASRVQALAEGGQIVCTEEMWNQPGVQDVVAGRGFSFRREQPLLKGIADRFPVRRIVVAAVPSAAQGRRAAPRISQTRPRTAARRGTARGVARPAQHSGTRGKRAARRHP